MKKIFFIITLLYAAVIPAQRITLCKAYTNQGEPIDLIYPSNLTLNQSACILFSGENKKISGKQISLIIDRITGAGRENQLNKIFKPGKENWIAHFYKFVNEGKFEIYFADEQKNRISSLTFSIGTPKETKQAEPPFNEQYIGAEITICERVEAGSPVNVKRSISLGAEGGTIYIYLTNNRPLETKIILVKTWRRNKYSTDYNEFVDNKKYQIEGEWNDTYFRYRFSKPGEYKIQLYDDKELLIKTAYISVTD